MRNYEVLYIISPNVDEDGVKNTIERYNKILTDNGAEIEKVDEVGKKRLAYEINDFRDGYYVVTYIKGTADATNEFDRLVKIDDNVIRHLVVRNDD
ncbi:MULTISPECIES: 30S ribosomal protein S6 [Marinococcus]|jgi:small subunit ribosomal protein S6|uniref:Small ribosomal subunit protein bS6 n=2 Tax=Marinococcus TaxID=1370 RepID=A0A1H2W9C7_9BACI|nr:MULTISPECIES: 30S ribosomal protein S6 [Marinococcus]MDX6154342.1 30S ribosomal protein S6 [Marinococcus sp. PL1-022]MDZ5782525.1 30S ribosomal protein S6 [Marinococcus luteus]OZT80666.1 30S ribosomal protein S6 [Marinococcus halophilus]SDW77147.1 SSU ribosomal protein S6P [Marinococcus luteus]GEK59634.1 30S ribosomal protein S6 [Marinococcus halophilus]